MNKVTLASCELKTCPMCGSKAEMLQGGTLHQFYPRCTGHTMGYCLLSRYPNWTEDGFEYEKDAIKVWNRRHK